MKTPTKIFIAALFASLVLGSAVVPAQALTWQQLDGPYGGEIWIAFEGADGTVFSSNRDGAGVWRSSDGGNTWVRKTNGLDSKGPRAFAESGSYVFLGSSQGVSRSSDSGELWVQTSLATSVESLVVVQWSDATESLFAGTTAGVHRSDDLGLTWLLVDTGFPAGTVRSLATIDWGDGTDSLFAMIPSNGVYRTDDRGATWIAKNVGTLAAQPAFNGLTAAGTTLYFSGAGIFRSDDGGDTWTASNTGLPTLNTSAVLAMNGSVFTAVDWYGVYRSDDGGGTWASKSTGFFDITFVKGFTQVGPDILVTGASGMYRSGDAGESWSSSQAGIRAADVRDILIQNGTVYAATFGSLFFSTDSGSTWTQGVGINAPALNAVAALGSDLYIGTSHGSLDLQEVYRSSDGGITWAPTAEDLSGSSVRALAAQGSTMFAGTSGEGVYRTDDAGASCVQTNGGLAGSALTVRALLVDGSLLLAGTDSGLYLTSDGGSSWTSADASGIQVLSLVNTGTHLLAGRANAPLLRSSDGGSTFTTAGTSPGIAYSLTHADGVIYAGTSTIKRSDDNGDTWVSDSAGLDIPLGNVYALAVDGGTLLAGTSQASIFASPLGPAASTSPAAVDVGVVVASTGTGTFDVTNTGSGLLTVSDIAADDAQFTVAPTAFTLDDDLSQTVTVTFAPTVVGWETATLTIAHDGAGGSATVAASGIGSVVPPAGELTTTRVAFSTNRDTDHEIYAMDVTGVAPLVLANPVNLTNAGGTNEQYPAWSPDGSKIVYTSASALEVRATDGTGTPTVLAAAGRFASWSPDGSTILFDSWDSGTGGVSTINADGTGRVDLTTDGGFSPVWSPDGTKIAYVSFDAPQHIRVMRANGSAAKDLPAAAGIDPQVIAWLPDGAQLAFIGTAPVFDVYTVDADGSNVVNVTNGALSNPLITYPFTLAPDGTTALISDDEDIVAVDLSGGVAPYAVVTDTAGDYGPAWSSYLNLGDVTLTVADAQGQVGSTAVIPIPVTDVTGLAVVGIELTLTYDATLLTPQDDGGGNTTAVTLGPDVIPGTWTVQQHVPTPGELKIAMAGDFATPAAGVWVVVSVAFDISVSATAGATSLMSLTQTRVNEGVITSVGVDGTFTVLSLVYGDVTGNGDVSALDAAWVLEYVVNDLAGTPVTFPIEDAAPTWAPSPLTPEHALEVADVDDDGAIMALDASDILKFLVELIPNFAAEGGAPAAPVASAVGANAGMTASATAYRPGGIITVSLDTARVADLYAGELSLEYDARVLRPVKVSLSSARVGDAGALPLLVHREGDGVLDVAFASARPIGETTDGVDVDFEINRNLQRPVSGAIRASHLRLNRTSLDPSFVHPYDIRPYEFALYANYPNPFNPETWIPFELSSDADVTITVYGMDGRVVRTLDLGARAMGDHTSRSAAAYWDGRNAAGEPVASALYVYELRAGEDRSVRRMLLMK
jgi:hypothetical protein